MSKTLSDTKESSNYFRHIDSLRAFAALAVFGYHCKTEFHLTNYIFLKPVFDKGDLGVVLFYLLSGFVIFGSLDRLKNKQESVSFKSLLKLFWLKRFMRIYPLYILSILVVFILDSSVRNSSDIYNILTHIFGIHSFFRAYHGSINGVLWTLSLELQFYLIAPFLFLVLSKFSSFILLLFSLLLWITSYIISRYLLIEGLAMWGTGNADRVDSWSYFMGLNQLHNVLIFFLLGYLAFRNRQKQLSYLWGIVPASLLIGSYFEHHFASLISPLCDVYLFNYIRQLVYASGFYLILRLLTQPSITQSISVTLQETFEWLGKISYGIYIWHLLIIRVVQQTMLNTSNTQNILIALFATIIVADFSYRHIESRFIAFSKKVAK